MNYIGSKRDIANKLVKVILDNLPAGGTYIEPFCGGCSVAEELPQQHYKIYLSDHNPYLISLFKSVQEGWKLPVKPLPKKDWEYALNNKDFDPAKTGYFGYLYSIYGGFFHGYCPISSNINHYQRNLTSLNKTMAKLSTAEFHCHSYEELVIPEGDTLIYCDPPDIGESNRNSFKREIGFNHEKFWNWVREISKSVKVLVTEKTAPSDFVAIKTYSVFDAFGMKATKEAQSLYVHKSQSSSWKYRSSIKIV